MRVQLEALCWQSRRPGPGRCGSEISSMRLRDLIVLSASSCVDALLAASAKASSNSCAAAAVSGRLPRATIICRDGFFDSVSEPKYEPKSFGSADTSRNPQDSIPLDALPAFATRISASIAAELDREWIEQEDHVLVGNEAARLYLQSRNDPAESTDIGMILAYIGGGLESYDMGECFVGPWEVANMASALIMRENYPESTGFGFYSEDSKTL